MHLNVIISALIWLPAALRSRKDRESLLAAFTLFARLTYAAVQERRFVWEVTGLDSRKCPVEFSHDEFWGRSTKEIHLIMLSYLSLLLTYLLIYHRLSDASVCVLSFFLNHISSSHHYQFVLSLSAGLSSAKRFGLNLICQKDSGGFEAAAPSLNFMPESSACLLD